jgi:hypothetical protein
VDYQEAVRTLRLLRVGPDKVDDCRALLDRMHGGGFVDDTEFQVWVAALAAVAVGALPPVPGIQ